MCVVHMYVTPGRAEMAKQQRDVEKERYWAKMVREATRSGASIREFCKQRKLNESQFYWWQRKLRERRAERAARGGERQKARSQAATFALVSDEPGQLDCQLTTRQPQLK